MGNSKSKNSATPQNVPIKKSDDVSNDNSGDGNAKVQGPETPSQDQSQRSGIKRLHDDIPFASNSKRLKTYDDNDHSSDEWRSKPSAPPLEDGKSFQHFGMATISFPRAKVEIEPTPNATRRVENEDIPALLDGEQCQICHKIFIREEDMDFWNCGHYYHKKCALDWLALTLLRTTTVQASKILDARPHVTYKHGEVGRTCIGCTNEDIDGILV